MKIIKLLFCALFAVTGADLLFIFTLPAEYHFLIGITKTVLAVIHTALCVLLYKTDKTFSLWCAVASALSIFLAICYFVL